MQKNTYSGQTSEDMPPLEQAHRHNATSQDLPTSKQPTTLAVASPSLVASKRCRRWSQLIDTLQIAEATYFETAEHTCSAGFGTPSFTCISCSHASMLKCTSSCSTARARCASSASATPTTPRSASLSCGASSATSRREELSVLQQPFAPQLPPHRDQWHALR